MSKAQICLTLIGEDFNTKSITESLETIPQYVREKNETLNNGREFGHTEWGINTAHEDINDLNDFFQTFMCCFEGKLNLMKKIADNNNAEWHFLIQLDVIDDDFPSIYFDSKSISIMHSLNARIGLDVQML